MNYRGPDHSIYQALVLYQVQSGLRAYYVPQPPTSTSTSNHLPRPQPQPQPQSPMAYWPRHLHYPDVFIPSYMPHDSRHTPVDVSASDLVRSRPTYFVKPGGYSVYYQRGLRHSHQVL